MIFQYPQCLALLLVLIAVHLWLRKPGNSLATRLPGSWHRLVSPSLQSWLLRGFPPLSNSQHFVAVACASLLIVALAHPVVDKSVTTPPHFSARVIVLDMSAEVEVEAQRFFVENLLLDTPPTPTALVLVGDSAYSVVPLTTDTQHLQRYLGVALPELMPAAGRALHQGITQAEALLADAQVSVGQVVLVSSAQAPAAKIALPQGKVLRELVVVGTSDSGWQAFARFHSLKIRSAEHSSDIIENLQVQARAKLRREYSAARTDLRPLLLFITLLLWLMFFRQRARL